MEFYPEVQRYEYFLLQTTTLTVLASRHEAKRYAGSRHVSQDSQPPGLHQPQLPHADDRGSIAPADHAGGGERVRQVHLAPLDLLRASRRTGRELRLPPRQAGGGSGQGRAVRRRAAQSPQQPVPVRGPAAHAGIPAYRKSWPGDALALPGDVPAAAGRVRAAAGRTRDGAIGLEPETDSEDAQGTRRQEGLPHRRRDTLPSPAQCPRNVHHQPRQARQPECDHGPSRHGGRLYNPIAS